MKTLHNGMQANVVQGSEASDQFTVTNGAKLGCVLAQHYFHYTLLLCSILHSGM